MIYVIKAILTYALIIVGIMIFDSFRDNKDICLLLVGWFFMTLAFLIYRW